MPFQIDILKDKNSLGDSLYSAWKALHSHGQSIQENINQSNFSNESLGDYFDFLKIFHDPKKCKKKKKNPVICPNIWQQSRI